MRSASTCRFCAEGGTLGVTDRIDQEAPPVDADVVDADIVDAGGALPPADVVDVGALPPPTDRVEKEHPVDVTRYLAAAAYLDETFRAEVLAQTMRQKHRFIAPSYGVDIGCVVRHCLASRRLSRRRSPSAPAGSSVRGAGRADPSPAARPAAHLRRLPFGPSEARARADRALTRW